MSKGYAGRILHVDLTKGEVRSEEPTDVFFRTYFGGPGIGLHYLLKEMEPNVDAMSPDNVLPGLFYEPFKAGPLEGKGAIDPREFANALETYYEMAGWDTPDGRPSDAKLAELGLDWVQNITAASRIDESRKAAVR